MLPYVSYHHVNPNQMNMASAEGYVKAAAVQDPAQLDSWVVDSLFGVKLHTSLKCEESGESIEVRDTLRYTPL